MAHVDADFLALAKRFGQMLPPGPAMFWGGVLDNYEKGNIPKEIVIKSMDAMILARVSLPHGRIRQHHCTTNRQAGTCGGEKGSPHRGPRFLQALINGQTCTAGVGLEKKAV